MTNPTRIRHEVRVKLGVLDKLAAEVFALTVFLCDVLLQLKRTRTSNRKSGSMAAAVVIRFFVIAKRLPLELQMILCRRVVDSSKDTILSKDSEAAFKSLARILLLDSQSG